jgi:hypothetical protein
MGRTGCTVLISGESEGVLHRVVPVGVDLLATLGDLGARHVPSQVNLAFLDLIDEDILRLRKINHLLNGIPPEKRDKTLLTRLQEEGAGILAWAVRGHLEWREMGLCPPEEVAAATRDYREEMDMIGAWLTEHCVQTPHARVQASAAYHDYSKWTDARGARPMS